MPLDDAKHIEIIPIGLQQIDRLADKQRYSAFFPTSLDRFQDVAGILHRIETEKNDVRPDLDERFYPLQRIGDHEVNLERPGGVSAELGNQIREEEQILDVVPIRDIQMPAFSERFDAHHLGREIAKVGRPERSGAFDHVDS